jgi:ABC-type glutathione transport system ATPase component
MSPVLEVRDLVKEYPVRGGLLRRETNTVKAVNGISLTLERGKTLGLVGETGCGKSTVGRCLVNLVTPTSGSVLLDGQDLSKLTAKELRAARRRIQLVFQDPYASLDPRQSISSILVEPLRLHKLAQGQENQRIVSWLSLLA